MSGRYARRGPCAALILSLGVVAISLGGCTFGTAPEFSQDVTVAPLRYGETEAATATGIKRAQLEAEIMRFADRYAGRMATEMFRIQEQDPKRDLRWFTTGWIKNSRIAVVDIAIGPNAVENLLDMLVLTSLTRHSVETYWAPEFLGNELGAGLVDASRVLEQDIWRGADIVLTPDQQADLRALIDDWIEQNPDQFLGVAAPLAHDAGGGYVEEGRVAFRGDSLRQQRLTRPCTTRHHRAAVRGRHRATLDNINTTPGLWQAEVKVGI